MTAELLAFALLALVGILFSAVFSGTETGLYTINRVRLTVRASRGEFSAVRLRDFLNKPNRMLSTLLLGNNMANYAGSLGIAAILDHMGVSPWQAVAINAGILVPLLFVFGETLPKDLFRTYTDVWSYRFAGFLTWTGRILTWIGLVPLVQVFGDVMGRLLGSDILAAAGARQRISHLIAEGVGAGVLSESQTTLADRALALREFRVGDEMVPWKRVIWVPADAGHKQRVDSFRRRAVTRAPVVDAHGNVIGSLNLIDAVLEADAVMADLLQPVAIVHPATRVREALQQMQAQRCAMAVVVAPRSHRPIGIVTFKDLVEPLTGELSAW